MKALHTLLRVAALVAVLGGVVAGGAAQAAETDPYYGWLHPPRDGTIALNTSINRELERGLRDVNQWDRPRAGVDVGADGRPLTIDRCAAVAAKVAAPLSTTAAYYWAGSVRFWNVDRSPRTRTEYDKRFRLESTYRYSALLPFGSLVPLDPSVRVQNVVFGTDKIGHFFTNGLRGFQRYVEARAKGAAADVAERATVNAGIDEERGILGLGVSGIFSYADLEANDAGLRFFRDLCESGDLVAVKDTQHAGKLAWALARPFDIARYVDPCWDEGANPSAFTSPDPIAHAVADKCTALLAARSKRYPDGTTARCTLPVRAVLDELRRVNAVPAPLTLDEMCAEKTSVTSSR